MTNHRTNDTNNRVLHLCRCVEFLLMSAGARVKWQARAEKTIWTIEVRDTSKRSPQKNWSTAWPDFLSIL